MSQLSEGLQVYLAKPVFGNIRMAEAQAAFQNLASGYRLCHDRTLAEAVVLSRAAAYGSDEARTYARIPLQQCDFSGEIGNIIVALSNRCFAAEQQRDELIGLLKGLGALDGVSQPSPASTE